MIAVHTEDIYVYILCRQSAKVLLLNRAVPILTTGLEMVSEV
jgi:hypothetical protein